MTMSETQAAGLEGEAVAPEGAFVPAAPEPETAALFRQALARRERSLREAPADYVLANPRIAELHAVLTQSDDGPTAAMPAFLGQSVERQGAVWQPGVDRPRPATPDRRRTIAAYVNATLAQQAHLGVPDDARAILPKATAQAIVARLADATPSEAVTLLQELADDYGAAWGAGAPGEPHSSDNGHAAMGGASVLRDLERADLPAEYRAIARIADPVARKRLAAALEAEQANPGAARRALGEAAAAIDRAVRDRFADIITAAGDARENAGRRTGEMASAVQQLSKPAKLLAYRYAAALEPEAAADQALTDFFGRELLPPRTTMRPTGNPRPPVQLASLDAALAGQIDLAQSQHGFIVMAGSTNQTLPRGRPVFDDDGHPVVGASGAQLRVPDGWDLNYFALKGETLRGRDALGRLNGYAPGLALAHLALFQMGWPWDLQRIGAPEGKINHEFRDAATVAVGIYAAAIGIPFDELMKIQADYAKDHNFDEPPSKDYPPLPERNVENTMIGYELYHSGRIAARRPRKAG